MPSDMEVEVLLDLPYAEEEEQEKPALVTDADSSSAAVYNADFGGPCPSLIRELARGLPHAWQCCCLIKFSHHNGMGCWEYSMPDLAPCCVHMPSKPASDPWAKQVPFTRSFSYCTHFIGHTGRYGVLYPEAIHVCLPCRCEGHDGPDWTMAGRAATQRRPQQQ